MPDLQPITTPPPQSMPPMPQVQPQVPLPNPVAPPIIPNPPPIYPLEQPPLLVPPPFVVPPPQPSILNIPPRPIIMPPPAPIILPAPAPIIVPPAPPLIVQPPVGPAYLPPLPAFSVLGYDAAASPQGGFRLLLHIVALPFCSAPTYITVIANERVVGRVFIIGRTGGTSSFRHVRSLDITRAFQAFLNDSPQAITFRFTSARVDEGANLDPVPTQLSTFVDWACAP
ncbi:Uncharacterized protein PBTT_05338 [Plasmodiophora brassicae]